MATGARAKWLNLPEELEFRTKIGGVSACATCDGFFYKGKEVLVVGGGDTAMEEASFLSKFASKVTIVHRRAELRASKAMQTRAKANPKVAWLLDSVIEKVLGGPGKGVTGAMVRNLKTGEVREVPCGGIFMAIGHTPNTAVFAGQLEMDEQGYLLVHDGTTATSVPGVFAGGDVADHRYRQAITAAGSGCMAAIDAERFLAIEDPLPRPPAVLRGARHAARRAAHDAGARLARPPGRPADVPAGRAVADRGRAAPAEPAAPRRTREGRPVPRQDGPRRALSRRGRLAPALRPTTTSSTRSRRRRT